MSLPTRELLVVWHYTTGAKLRQIVESGEIRPATVGVEPPEIPVVWFSSNRVFEMTARKGVIRNGVRRDASLEGWTGWRDGSSESPVDSEPLLPWKRVLEGDRMRPQVAAALRRAADKMGGQPREWFAALRAIPRGEWLSIEKRDSMGRWQPFDAASEVEQKS